jgi:hypothetical protein
MKESKYNDNVVKAIYTDPILPEYRGNPLIEALPPIWNREEIYENILYLPPFNKKEKELDRPFLLHCLKRITRQLFIPMPIHFEIENRISYVIRQGYILRNLLSPNQASDLQELHKAVKIRDSRFDKICLSDTATSGFSVVGYSGVGKTYAVERILGLYPQFIYHENYNGNILNHLQIVWIKLTCPFDGSIKGLCKRFFEHFDYLTNDNTYSKFAAARNTTADSMIPRMAQIARRHSLGVLVVDEIQNLNVADSGGQEKMLNFFVNLINDIGLPVILIGTNKVFPLLQREHRQMRRTENDEGYIIWENFKKDKTWELFIEVLWSFQWTRKAADFSEEFSSLFYEETQGLVDFTVKLFAMAQKIAIESNEEKFTPAIVKKTAREVFGSTKKVIEAIKSGDKEKLAMYEDLFPLKNDFFKNKSTDTLPRVDLRRNPEFSQFRGQENKEKSLKYENIKSSEIYAENVKQYNPEVVEGEDLREIVANGRKSGLTAYESLKEYQVIGDTLGDKV